MRTYAIYQKTSKGLMELIGLTRFPEMYAPAEVHQILSSFGKIPENTKITYHF